MVTTGMKRIAASMGPNDYLFVILNSLFALLYLAAILLGATDAASLVFAVFFAALIPAALLLIGAAEKSSSPLLRWVRAFYPQAMYVVFFTQCMRLGLIFHADSTFDRPIAMLEELIFHGRPVMDVFNAIPKFPALNELAFFGYFSFYLFLTVPWWILYFRGKKPEARTALFSVSAAFGLLYFWYIVFPVAGPKFYYPELYSVWYEPFHGGVFTWFMKHMFSPATTEGAAFPSSHVAIGLLSLLLTLRYNRTLGLWLVPFYVLLVFSTIYLYTHYVVDVIAGLAAGLVFFRTMPALYAFSVRQVSGGSLR